MLIPPLPPHLLAFARLVLGLLDESSLVPCERVFKNLLVGRGYRLEPKLNLAVRVHP